MYHSLDEMTRVPRGLTFSVSAFSTPNFPCLPINSAVTFMSTRPSTRCTVYCSFIHPPPGQRCSDVKCGGQPPGHFKRLRAPMVAERSLGGSETDVVAVESDTDQLSGGRRGTLEAADSYKCRSQGRSGGEGGIRTHG